MSKASNNPLRSAHADAITQNTALRYKLSQAEKLLASRELEIGATRNLLGAAIVAVGGRVRITEAAASQSYELRSEHDADSLTFTFEANVADVIIDAVESETLPDDADTDNPEHGTDNALANN